MPPRLLPILLEMLRQHVVNVCRERHPATRQHHRDFGDALVILASHIDRLAVTGRNVHTFEVGRFIVRSLPWLAPFRIRRFPSPHLLHGYSSSPSPGFPLFRVLRTAIPVRAHLFACHHSHQQFLVDRFLIPPLLHNLPV